MSALYDHARRLVIHYGFSVIPVRRPSDTHTGKEALVKWQEFTTRHPSPDELARWFQCDPPNLGIITGAISGVCVIDVDSVRAEMWARTHLPETPWHTLTAKGRHRYYRQRAGETVRNRVTHGAIRIDVRGDSGYVVGAGSRHQSGVVYQLAGDWSAAREAVPIYDSRWLRDLTPDRDPVLTTPRVHGSSTPIVERARAYLAKIPRPEIGCGSNAATLYAACRLVRGFALSASEAEDLLWDWCGGRPGWDRDWVAARVQHAVRYGTEAIGWLR